MLLPVRHHVGHTPVDLGVRVIWQSRLNETHVQRRFAPVRGDLQEVVVARVYLASHQLFRPDLNHILDVVRQLFRGFCHDSDSRASIQFRGGQHVAQVLGRPHVGELPVQLDEFRHVNELGEPGALSIAALGGCLQRRFSLPESPCPVVESVDTLRPHGGHVKVPAEREHLRHGVRDRCPCAEVQPPVAVLLEHVLRLHEQVYGTARLRAA